MCHLQGKTTKQLIWKLGFVTRNHFLFYSSIRNAQQTMSNYERHTLDMEKFIVHKLRHQHAKLENCKNQFGHKFNFNANMRKLFNNSIRISTPEWAMEANLIQDTMQDTFHISIITWNSGVQIKHPVSVESSNPFFNTLYFAAAWKLPNFFFFSLKQGKHRIVGHSHIYTTSFKLGKSPSDGVLPRDDGTPLAKSKLIIRAQKVDTPN